MPDEIAAGKKGNHAAPGCMRWKPAVHDGESPRKFAATYRGMGFMTETSLNIDGTLVRVAITGNIIALQVCGRYTDRVAQSMMDYLDPIIDRIPDAPIRIWDASRIPEGAFLLTNGCIDIVARWGKAIKEKKPGSMAYMVSPTDISYGMSRMYGIKSELEETGVVVVRTVGDLPKEIRDAIPPGWNEESPPGPAGVIPVQV